MKRYISYIACLALSIIAIGCVKSDIGSDIEQGGELTLQFSNSALTTRATRANDSSNNEDLLKSVQLFFYPKDSETSNAVYTYTVANFPTTDANGKASTADTANKSTTVKIKISAGDLDKMFPNNATVCSVYAIANGPTPATNAATDVASLKAMSIEADFTTATQASFVMDSDICTIEKKDGKNLSGTVELTRAAAKIELAVNASNIVIDGKTYMPQIANMKVALLRGVKKGLVDDGSDEIPVDHNVAADYFDINIDPGRGFTNGVQTTPFYSYSSMWEAGEDDEATLKLMIPWGVSADGTTAPSTYLNYIYEVPVNDLDKSIVRNKYYKITLNVGVLGSLDEKPVKLNPSYVVLDWGTGEVDVELSRPKYLVVDENSVVMNNINSYSVGYQSSDAITVKIVSLTRDDLSDNTAGTTTYHSSTAGVTSVNAGQQDTANKYKLLKTCSVSVEKGQIVFSHDLVNTDENTNNNADGYPTTGDYRNRDDYDFAPYYITLLVEMQVDNSTSFRETITITQYPQMYIKAHQNSDFADGNNDRNGDHNVMVNGYYSTQSNNGYGSTVYNKSTNQQTFGTVPGLWVLGGDTNVNPNMYVINVTKFSSDSNYFIGDPRQTTNDTALVNETWDHDNNWRTENVSIWVNTNALYEGPTRRLKYYYPTDQTMTGTDNTNPASYATGYMIAPKIRVASSYSVTHNTDSKDLAEKRCASYQEDGYPAGRWRLPTYAEAAFIVGLSNELKIPRLFNTGTRYWCAHGQFLPTTNGVTLNGTSGNAASSVRCVYDEWYWGSEQLPENQRGTFTWGDEPRAN